MSRAMARAIKNAIGSVSEDTGLVPAVNIKSVSKEAKKSVSEDTGLVPVVNESVSEDTGLVPVVNIKSPTELLSQTPTLVPEDLKYLFNNIMKKMRITEEYKVKLLHEQFNTKCLKSIISLVKNCNVDVNSRDQNGYTLLDKALASIDSDHTEMIELLINLGADKPAAEYNLLYKRSNSTALVGTDGNHIKELSAADVCNLLWEYSNSTALVGTDGNSTEEPSKIATIINALSTENLVSYFLRQYHYVKDLLQSDILPKEITCCNHIEEPSPNNTVKLLVGGINNDDA